AAARTRTLLATLESDDFHVSLLYLPATRQGNRDHRKGVIPEQATRTFVRSRRSCKNAKRVPRVSCSILINLRRKATSPRRRAGFGRSSARAAPRWTGDGSWGTRATRSTTEWCP